MHYNGANSYLFVNGKKMVMFKTKDSEIAISRICLGNISRDWSADNMKKTGLNRCDYEFNVDYRTFNPSNLHKNASIIHECFIVKYGIV